FRTMVTRAIGTLQRKGGIAKPELQLQTLEAQHLARVARKGAGASDDLSSSSGSSRNDDESSGGRTSDNERDGSSSGGGSGDAGKAAAKIASGANDTRGKVSVSNKRKRARRSGSGTVPMFDPDSESGPDSRTSSDDGRGDLDLEQEQAKEMAAAALPATSHMNNSLLDMYARTATTGVVEEPGSGACAVASIVRRGSSPPAFASPEVIAAAAARALTRERAERKEAAARKAGRTSMTDPGLSGRAAANLDGPSTSGRPAASARIAVMQTTEAVGPGAELVKTAAPVILTAAGSLSAVAGGAALVAAASKSQGECYRTEIVEQLPPSSMTLSQPQPQPQPHLQAQPSQVKSAVKRARRLTTPGGSGAGGGLGFGGAGGGGGGSAVTTAKPVLYADLGGIEEVLTDIRELIEYPLKHPEVYAWLGVEPPRGVLLHGPPGCGKTALANAIANECGVPFLRVSAPEIVSGMSGESEAKLRQLFGEARDLAPCIVFIDEIDAIFPKRETAQREMERRIVAQMLTCMDDLSAAMMVQPPQLSAEALAAAAPPGPPHSGTGEGNNGGATGTTPFQPSSPPPHVVVIGATNRPDALDPALRRAGRFDREIALGIPTEAARVKILQVISRRLRLEGNFDFRIVAKRTPGFVGADLAALTKEAAAVAVTRIFAQLAAAEAAGSSAAVSAQLLAAEAASVAGTEAGITPSLASARLHRLGGGPLGPAELEGLAITMADFEAALPKVQPSVRREGFTTTPDVTWDDVGALAEVREELSFAITEPIRNPECFEALGLPAATGVLLYGPPGCGKTLVAKAVANESGANFISIKGPELLNKYVGESERAVRQLFARARAAHPCVLFFDEMDALAPRRGTDNNQAAERVVNQLLTEMDGVDSRQGIFMVAATNRPDMIDPALLRPGRLDKVLYVPLPPPGDRAAILRALVRRTPLELGVDLDAVAVDPRCDGFSGADMEALVREAAVAALKESMAAGPAAPSPRVGKRHFEAALRRVLPSVNRKDRKAYEALRLRLRSTRAHIQPDADSIPAVGAEGPCADSREVGARGGGTILGGDRDGDGDALLEDVAADTVAAVLANAGAAIHGPVSVGNGGGDGVAVFMEDQDGERHTAAEKELEIAVDSVALWPRSGQIYADGEGDGDVMETA
ncbi:hypothetical protein VaNZ11_006416, partial [Volvox africanus]